MGFSARVAARFDIALRAHMRLFFSTIIPPACGKQLFRDEAAQQSASVNLVNCAQIISL